MSKQEQKFERLLRTMGDQDTVQEIIDELRKYAKQGYINCRICNKRFNGNSWGDLLSQLGAHAQQKHPASMFNFGPVPDPASRIMRSQNPQEN